MRIALTEKLDNYIEWGIRFPALFFLSIFALGIGVLFALYLVIGLIPSKEVFDIGNIV